MTVNTPDAMKRPGASRLRSGIGFALISALAFGLSGPLARLLIESGWTPGAAVTVRILGAAIVLTIPALVALRGRYRLLLANIGLIAAYGGLAVAATQLCFFYAVSEIDVGIALLIEFTAPVAVVLWMWWRRGQRPGRLTVVGGIVAAGGLLLVLEVFTGAPTLTLPGVLWAFGAMIGVAAYFVLSGESDADQGLPPLVLAWGGLWVGGTGLAIAGALGILPWVWHAVDVVLPYGALPWWVPVLGLAVITAAFAYATGIAAIRRLGSRLASFVALSEVLAGVLLAWLLLFQVPGLVQLLGGALIVGGVVLVRLGEDRIEAAAQD